MQESALAQMPVNAETAGRSPVRIRGVVVHKGAVPGCDRIQIRAGNGVTGYGEGEWGEEVLRVAPELLIGRSPFAVENIFEELTARTGKTPGGLDIALWDACARSLETPLCSLLGKTYRQEVRVCAPRGQDELSVDGVDFSEEPFPADPAAYRGLRGQSGATIAAGRTFPLDVLIRDYLQTRLIDLALPEIGSCGLTGLRRLAYYGWIFHVRLAVRCSGSPIALAAALHAAACFVPVSRAIAAPPGFVVVPDWRGAERVAVPQGPGLGVSPQPESGPPYLAIGD
jgi:L-alanine-DL-glutamate epimerase-like enolase superfamily enzyme